MIYVMLFIRINHTLLYVVKSVSKKMKWYLGMGGVTGKGENTAHVIALVCYILVLLKSNNVANNMPFEEFFLLTLVSLLFVFLHPVLARDMYV